MMAVRLNFITKKNKFYITTPLYYVNASPHIGHSYTQIATDTLARFHRLLGDDVFFLTGTDEHGEKIEKATIEAGLKRGEEKAFVDGIVPNFKKLWKDLNTEYDLFIRTTDDFHQETVSFIMDLLHKKGDIYKDKYEGYFCVPCEMFWSKTQAPDGMCPDCKRRLEHIKEDNYFFKTSKYQSWLIDYIKKNPRFIMPDYRRNEVLSFLENNRLNDLCISRSKRRLDWGIELPFDKDYVTYVWFDALVNYISGAGYLKEKKRFKRLWPAEFHIIGKDILRHHAVYWPIMLHACNIALPKTVFAHGWWTIKDEKMSKSKGNVVDPHYIIGQYGVDPYRYFLLREMPFGLDGNFSESALINRFNSDLANDLGNLLNRTLTMVEKHLNGSVPGSCRQKREYKEAVANMVVKLEGSMKVLNFSEALSSIWVLVNRANKSIEVTAPWKLAKEKRCDELAGFLYELLETLRVTAIAISSFMPETALKMWKQLGLEGFDKIKFNDITRYGLIKAGTKVNKGLPIFPRIKK